MTDRESWLAGVCYEDVKLVLDQIARRFFRRCGAFPNLYGGDASDIRADLEEVYLIAFSSHRPGKGSLEAWLRQVAYSVLGRRYRWERKRRTKLARHDAELDEIGVLPPEFDLDEFLTGLSDDAQTLVKLVFRPPRKLRLVFGTGANGDDPGATARRIIRDYLRATGWTGRRIAQTFNEVRSAL